MRNIYPKIAVLLPVFKGVKYLRKQIESIIKQKKVDLKIYLSIDPCADGSIEYVNNLEKKYNNIKVLRHSKIFRTPTKHFFFLINQIDENDYDYISLSDQDDIWFDDKIYKSIHALKEKKADCYSGSVIAFNGEKKKIIIKSKNQTKYDYFFEAAGPGSTYVMSQNFLKNFKKFIFQKKKAFLFKNYDWLIYAFARENDYKWLIDERPSLYYRQHSGNFIGARWTFNSIYFRFKEVTSGRAFKEVNNLTNLLLTSKNKLQKLTQFENNFFLLRNSFIFRRRILDKILLFFYFLTTLLFGEFQKNTFRLSLGKTFSSILILAFLTLGKDMIYIYAEKLKAFNIFQHFTIFLLFGMILIFISLRYLILINSISNIKINFFYWYKVFIEGQILSLFLPYTSTFYRYYYLNKIVSFKFENLFKITVFIFIQEQIILFILILFNLLLTNSNLLILNLSLIFFTSTCYYIFIKNYNLLSSYFINFFKRFNFTKNYNFYLGSISLSDMRKVFLVSLFKIFTSGIIFYFIAEALNIKLSVNQLLLVMFLNEILQNLKITPQNIGISELFFGLLFQGVFSLGIVNGVLYKIHHRILEILFYIIMSFTLKIVAVFFKRYKFQISNYE